MSADPLWNSSGHPTMAAITNLYALTLMEYTRFAQHMTTCKECGMAWRGLTGQDFKATIPQTEKKMEG